MIEVVGNGYISGGYDHMCSNTIEQWQYFSTTKNPAINKRNIAWDLCEHQMFNYYQYEAFPVCVLKQ